MFKTVTDELTGITGGVRMQLTQYGYRSDPYMDSGTRRGHGAYSGLAKDRSIAMTVSGMAALGLSPAIVRRTHPFVDIHLKGGGILTRRIDDRAPERNRRADLYQPGGFNGRLGDFADVTLHRR